MLSNRLECRLRRNNSRIYRLSVSKKFVLRKHALFGSLLECETITIQHDIIVLVARRHRLISRLIDSNATRWLIVMSASSDSNM